MSLRTLFILAAVAMALIVVTPVMAAPAAQVGVDAVVVTSTTTFTLTVRIDEVTTLSIPMQVDWRAEGPNDTNTDEVSVMISPSVLRQGIFSVVVGPSEPTTGTLAITLTQPASEPISEVVPITGTATTTATAVTTATTAPTTIIPTTTVGVPAVNGATTNQIANLRTGPGTEYPVVGSAEIGVAVDVVGQNSDGTWLVLASGTWVAAFLVDNVPANLPIVEPTALPLPTPAASDVLTQTVAPPIEPTATPPVTLIITPTPIPVVP